MKSYLENRQQFVSGAGFSSDSANVDVGVPQGSVLGPLLFLIHINDIKEVSNLKTINFADDTLLYNPFNNDASTESIEKVINTELGKVSKWLQENHLKLNTKKTKYMIFASEKSTWKNRRNMKIKIGQSEEIEKVDSYTYLGITIDSKLSWKPQINKLRTKLSQALGILYRTRPYLNKSSLILLLNSLFMSHLRYGLICWGRDALLEDDKMPKKLQPLQILLNKAMRCIYYRGPRENVDDLLKHNEILRFKDMVKLEIGKFMYNYSNNLLPETFDHFFTNIRKTHSHDTRHANNNYCRPKKRTNNGLKTLSYLGAKTWAQIPDDLKANTSTFSCTQKYKQILLE